MDAKEITEAIIALTPILNCEQNVDLRKKVKEKILALMELYPKTYLSHSKG